VLALVPVRAAAQDGQIEARIAIESDLRWRGYSLSAGHPVVTADLGYDDLSGFYLNGSVIAQLRSDEVRYLGFTASGGFAKRLGDRWTIDAGVVRAEYREAYPGDPEYRYTEIYVGVTRSPVLARISYSPDHFSSKVHTLYLETESSVKLPASFRLSGHAGVLIIVDQPPPPDGYFKTQYDWRATLSRPFGNAEVHVSLSGGGPSRDYYADASHSRTAVTVGASVSF
jgi:uncharacterized protein (TIGR02001 family)